MPEFSEGFTLEDDPLWYKDAISYELHVRAFYDSNDDGIGDFAGLTQKLDYLQDLGITAVWLLPFYPSPLRDDGYDIADYTAVHPSYGTVNDFRAFLREAHRRGIRVISELVLNHTSDQHAWFQRARRARPGSPARKFYVWNDTTEKYKEARIIFKDFETSNWTRDPFANQYYWHRFYHHQPDLNFESADVRRSLLAVVNFWLGMGVDGMRLDAVPYLYERDGTNCENLPETHQFLKNLRKKVDERFRNRMLLAEANQWPEDAIAYFGSGDECHMNFHFPLMPRLFMSLRMEDRYPIIDILEQTPPLPAGAQWAMFLRNHDELTLEMVTDEERDYMWRVYASDPVARINMGIRRRLAPLLANSRRKMELLNTMLLSMPGTPIIYYGDEIGMGDNIYLGDRNGCRTPMQWSPDRNAGFSLANPQQLHLPVIIDPEYHFEAINVENQQKNLSSLLWWMRRVIAMRKNFKAFSRGSLEFLYPDNAKVLAFLRRYENETIVVVANLLRVAQSAGFGLSRFAGCVPVEVFSRNRFPTIKKSAYVLTLGPHSHYWFTLQPQTERRRASKKRVVPTINTPPDLQTLLADGQRAQLEREILPDYIRTCRWFGAKARNIRGVKIVEQVPISSEKKAARFWFVEVSYTDGTPETYTLPVEISAGDAARAIGRAAPHAVIARFAGPEEAILFDAVWDAAFREKLFRLMLDRQRARGKSGELVGVASDACVQNIRAQLPASQVLGGEQSNSSMLFENEFFLKLYRKLEDGVNPDVEVTRFLTERGFPHVPSFRGAIEYRRGKAEPTVVCLLQSAVASERDGW